MKRNFIHNFYSSFVLWFDHTLLSKGEAFTNTTGKLYNIKDRDYPTSSIYGSPQKQWVYDSSISGALVPSGVQYQNQPVNRGTNGLKIDFQNGRAIFDNALGAGNVSGVYSVKDFNIYTTSNSDQELLFETSYLVNPEIKQIITGTNSDSLIAPCIFLKMKGFNNEQFALGGLDNTTVNMRGVILSNSEFNLNGVGNIFVDEMYNSITMLSDIPLNRYGDLKSGYYNYQQQVTANHSTNNLAYISNCSFTKFNESSFAAKFPDLFLGFLDFSIELPRYT